MTEKEKLLERKAALLEELRLISPTLLQGYLEVLEALDKIEMEEGQSEYATIHDVEEALERYFNTRPPATQREIAIFISKRGFRKSSKDTEKGAYSRVYHALNYWAKKLGKYKAVEAADGVVMGHMNAPMHLFTVEGRLRLPPSG